MEIKSRLNKPYTSDEKQKFVVEQNHRKGYLIQETESALEAWGYTQLELQEKEVQRLSQLKLTKREVFLALYKSCGLTPEQIKSGITDPEALIEFEYANEYYRGNPLIDTIGASLGYSKEQLDYLFENKCFEPIDEHISGGDTNA